MISPFESPSESMSGPERNRIHSPPDVATSAITCLRLAGMQRRALSEAASPVATGYDGPGQDRVRFVRDLPS
jgi:hypothetical protein